MRLYVLHRFPQDHRRGFLLFIRFQMLLLYTKMVVRTYYWLNIIIYCCVAWPGGVRSLARVGPVFRNIVPPPASACGLCCTPSSPAFSALGFTFALCEGFRSGTLATVCYAHPRYVLMRLFQVRRRATRELAAAAVLRLHLARVCPGRALGEECEGA